MSPLRRLGLYNNAIVICYRPFELRGPYSLARKEDGQTLGIIARYEADDTNSSKFYFAY